MFFSVWVSRIKEKCYFFFFPVRIFSDDCGFMLSLKYDGLHDSLTLSLRSVMIKWIQPKVQIIHILDYDKICSGQVWKSAATK